MTLFAKAEGGTGRPRSRRGAGLLLSFFLPFLIFTLAVLALHVEPFGSHNLAITDGQYYINSLLFLKRLLTGQENILYSSSKNLQPSRFSFTMILFFSVGLVFAASSTCSGIPSSGVQITVLTPAAFSLYSMSWASSWLVAGITTAPSLFRPIMAYQNW